MAIEHLMSTSPMGVVSLCRYWFDEDCGPDDAIAVAERASEAYDVHDFSRITIYSAVIWIKSRLLERRALWKGPPFEWIPPDPVMPEPGDAPPIELGWARSKISATTLVIQPVNGTAAKVIEFLDSTPCPYCRKHFRNAAAQKLHVIDRHLSDEEFADAQLQAEA